MIKYPEKPIILVKRNDIVISRTPHSPLDVWVNYRMPPKNNIRTSYDLDDPDEPHGFIHPVRDFFYASPEVDRIEGMLNMIPETGLRVVIMRAPGDETFGCDNTMKHEALEFLVLPKNFVLRGVGGELIVYMGKQIQNAAMKYVRRAILPRSGSYELKNLITEKVWRHPANLPDSGNTD